MTTDAHRETHISRTHGERRGPRRTRRGEQEQAGHPHAGIRHLRHDVGGGSERRPRPGRPHSWRGQAYGTGEGSVARGRIVLCLGRPATPKRTIRPSSNSSPGRSSSAATSIAFSSRTDRS